MMRRPILFLVVLCLFGCVTGSAGDGVQAVFGKAAEPEPLFRVLANKQWGFINRRGEIAIELQFRYAHDFSEGIAQVVHNDKIGYIDTQGRWLFDAPHTHDERPFRCGVAVYYTPQGPSLIDRQGNITECAFDWIEDFSEGMAVVHVDPERKKRKTPAIAMGLSTEKYGFIDTEGKLVVPTIYTAAGKFSHGLAPVYIGGVRDSCTGLREGSWGYIDKNGKLKIPAQFSSATSFSEGLALVSVGKLQGWIDTEGKFVIEPRNFYIAMPFQDGVARIRGNADSEPGWNDFGYITKQGKVFVHPAFRAASEPFSEGLAAARDLPTRDAGQGKRGQGEYGYVNKQGEWVIKPEYSHAQPFRSGLAMVQRDGALLYINKGGKVVWPPTPQLAPAP